MQKTNNNLIIKHFSRKREATALRLLLDVADKRGVSTPHILEGTQVTEADLSDPYFEIEAWQELVAIQNLVERDGDASLGIMSGGRVRQGGVISAVAVGHRQAALAVMCRG